MTGSLQYLGFLSLVGSDSYLSQTELPGQDFTEFASQAWELYAGEFGGFTGSQLDPLFHGLDSPIDQVGQPHLPSRNAVLVVGTGPSLSKQAGDLHMIRDRVYIFTSHRGAEALSRIGITPDLVLVQHASPLDAEISHRQQGVIGGLQAVAKGAWIAVEPKTPAGIIPGDRKERLFVPESLCGWGLWPASAVGLAIAAGAGRIGLLGVDLGSRESISPSHRPLAGLLSLIATVPKTCCFDCGIAGAVKRGWPKVPLQEFVPEGKVDPLCVHVRPRPSPAARRSIVAEAFEALQPIIAEARDGLTSAVEARSSPDGNGPEMLAWVERILAWKHPSEVRVRLQDTFGLSFLPRLWRSGVGGLPGNRLWRPVVLALDEIVRQAGALQAVLEGPSRPHFTGRSQIPSCITEASRQTELPRGPEVLVLPVTYSCNARCRICTIWRRSGQPSISPQLFKERLGPAADTIEVVNLTGGEPFLKRDLPEIVSILLENCPQLREVGIPTNGSMPAHVLEQVRHICGLLPPGVMLAVTVSIDGKPETHDAMRGIPGLHERAARTAQSLTNEARVSKNLTVGINMTVTSANLDDICAMERAAEEIGSGLILTPAAESDIFVKSTSADWAGSRDGLKELAQAIGAFARRHGSASLEDLSRVIQGAERQSPCVFWDHGAFLDLDGSVFVCPISASGRFGSVDDDGGLAEAWGSAAHRVALATLRSGACLSCLSNCMGSEAIRREVITGIRAQRRPIVIFGAGGGGRKALQHLRKAGVRVQAFVDNHAQRGGGELAGIPVYPWNGGEICRDVFVVIASSTGGSQIAGQLDSLGLTAGSDYVRYL